MRKILAVLLTALLLAGCAAQPAVPADTCQVVLEESEAFTATDPVQTVVRGGSVRFALRLADGYTLIGCDYPDAVLEPSADGYTLTLESVRYPAVVTVTAQQSDTVFICHANDGTDAAIRQAVLDTHARLNTPRAGLFARNGYTQTGWSTAPNGSGQAVVQGGRVDFDGRETLDLYAVWQPWTNASAFTWQAEGEGAVITGCTADDEVLAVPAEIDGCPVVGIASGALAGLPCREVVLPQGLARLEEGSIRDCPNLTTLTMFDDITSLHADPVQNCLALQTLRLQAAAAPRYSGGYFATFADKYDRLLALRDTRKLVLFSGSSTRFGYDSALLDAALSGYDVVNMGVFAYTNATPQLLLILDCMQAGDILLDSPEFDAAQRQFCTTDKLDDSFFCMMEANYQMLAALDLRQTSGAFAALTEYLSVRTSMPEKSYGLSPADFDEDGSPTDTPSYNEYGDYCLYRPNAEDDAPVYGLAVEYTTHGLPAGQFVTPLNAIFRHFLDKGVQVFFTYAPRNAQALSADSTPEARAELDASLRQNLCVPVLGTLEDSLWPGRYLYGTDNHLSTEGVGIRTRQVLAWLAEYLPPGSVQTG